MLIKLDCGPFVSRLKAVSFIKSAKRAAMSATITVKLVEISRLHIIALNAEIIKLLKSLQISNALKCRMIIKVFSRQQAVKQSYTDFDGSKIIISISDPFEEKAKFNRNNIFIKSVLYLSFYDIDEKTKSIFGGYDSMSPIDAVLIRDFVLKWENFVDEIWVQCEMGISRSAGIAVAIAEHFKLDSSNILNNSNYCPNMLCYKLTKEAFDKKEVQYG